MSRSHILACALGALLVIAGGGVVIGYNLTRYAYVPLPTYPHSIHLRISEHDLPALPHAEVMGKQRTIEFQTSDTVEVIGAFYQLEMARLGWQFIPTDTPDGRHLIFRWDKGALEHWQRVDIRVTSSDPAQQLVSISQGPSLGLK